MLKNVPSSERPKVDPQVEKEATKGLFSNVVPEPTGQEHDRKIAEGWQWCSDGYYFKTELATREQVRMDISNAFRLKQNQN